MIGKKEAAIVALLALLVITGVGWLSSPRESTTHDNIPPSDNTNSWKEIFPGYEHYLDNDYFYSAVSGTSMEPTFGDNDAVIWAEFENVENLNIGDVIIYNHPTKQGEGPIAHRIVDVMKNAEYRFETKGDNRSESDAHTALSSYYVGENNLIGLVIGVLHNIFPE